MIFVIIPYRDRPLQLRTLVEYFQSTSAAVQIILSEQAADKRSFNRGWCKNIGFLMANPFDADVVYFFDVDLLPGVKFYPFEETLPENTVIHLYGHKHCLGGIIGMRADTFRRLNGFRNDLWSWGGEDTIMQKCCERIGVHIDRSHFVSRFTNDTFIMEMNEHGKPMSGVVASRHFKRSLSEKVRLRQDSRGKDGSGQFLQLEWSDAEYGEYNHLNMMKHIRTSNVI